jgi:hypothetical protein
MAKSREWAGVPADGVGSPAAPAGTVPPPFGSPKVIDEAGPLPRVVNQLDRAPRGASRFKVRCANYLPRKVRYVLARPGDEAAAKECYLKAEALDAQVEKLKRVAGAKASEVEEPDLIATELKD